MNKIIVLFGLNAFLFASCSLLCNHYFPDNMIIKIILIIWAIMLMIIGGVLFYKEIIKLRGEDAR